MSTPENTSQRDPLVHLMGSGLGTGTSTLGAYIQGMEADGQRQIVASDKLPKDGDWAGLESLGFVKGEDTGDIFYTCTLPEGWKRAASDHSMWSYIEDERGVRRVAIFYKAAFYDRSAHFSIIRVGRDIFGKVLYSSEPVTGLPECWDILTEFERLEFWQEFDREVEQTQKYGGREEREPIMAVLREAREKTSS